MTNEIWGDPSPIETDPSKREFNSGPLVVGKAVFEPRTQTYTFSEWHGDAFGGFPGYNQSCPVPKQRADADALNHDYDTNVIHVDKRTHRIRFENETESGVTIVIEPK